MLKFISCSFLVMGMLHADPRVLYVDNTAPNGGDGSYAHPFNTLQNAETASGFGDTIFVSVGDGSSNGMNQGIVLKDNQNLMGSGFPLITNTSGVAVELADYNQVTGIHIDSSKSWGIHGSGINGAFIANNSITHSQHDGGIGIFDGAGQIQITKTTLSGSGGKTVGIHIESKGYTATDALVKWNIINNYDEGVEIYGYKNSSIVSEVSFNDISGTASGGVDVESFDQNYSTASILNNTVHDNSSNGIIAYSGSNLHSIISNNIVTGNTLEGIVVSTGNRGKHVSFNEKNILLRNGGQAGFLAETSLLLIPGDVMCLHLNNNESDTGYQLINYLGETFYFEVPNTNVGTINTKGIIKQVGPGYCQ